MSDVSAAAHDVNALEELARRIRDAHQAAQAAWCNALHHALDAGDALAEAQTRVSTGWKKWLRENCFLSVRTALLYQQLARHRAEIEAELERVGPLSLRAARRLIAEPRAPKPKPEKLVPDLLLAWNKATVAERTKALTRIPLGDFLQAMPAAWRTELRNRGAHLGDRDEGKARSGLDVTITQAIRKALSHLAITNFASASAQEHEALAALRGMNTKLRAAGHDLDDVEITLKAKRRKRVAA
jgi:hypothetical protein